MITGIPHPRQLAGDVLRKCLPRGYDEERRLLYVAMTRAESHLVFAAGESPNTFIEELPVDLEELEPDVSRRRYRRDDAGTLADCCAGAGWSSRSLAAHAHA